MTKEESHTEAESTPKKGRLNAVPWIAAALLVLGLAVIGGLYWSRTGTIRKVQFQGFHYLTEKQLKQQVDIPTGISPDSLNLTGIMKKLEKIPYVKRAGISIAPGGTMTINITERQPLALLAHGSHRAYVDADGIRLAPVPEKTPDVPILYGFKARPLNDTLKSDAFKRVSKFLQGIHKRIASDATISEVAWNADKGVIALTNENGTKLIFGKSDFDNRLRNWEAFYADVVRRKGIKQMQSVDLRFKGQIVTHEK